MAIYRNLVRSASVATLKTKCVSPKLRPGGKLMDSRNTPGETIRVFVGHEHQEFHVNRTQLCAASAYFNEKLKYLDNDSVMYLPRDSPAMFELFVAWVHDPPSFRQHLDDAINAACAAPPPDPAQGPTPTPSQRLHWALVRLHLFASMLSVAVLQDTAMDAIQDLYLRRDWDVTPRFISFIYGQCTPAASLRLRRWAVAMVTYSLSSPSPPRTPTAPRQFQELLREHAEFSAEYASHLRKMSSSGLDSRVKNPQLRIPANRLRNEERRFAFRQCAFHTHRASVGEGKCPHEVAAQRRKRMPVLGVPLPFAIEEEKKWWGGGVEIPRPLRTRAISGLAF